VADPSAKVVTRLDAVVPVHQRKAEEGLMNLEYAIARE